MTITTRSRRLLVVTLSLFLAACSGEDGSSASSADATSTADTGTASDAGADAGSDQDAATDATSDAATDADTDVAAHNDAESDAGANADDPPYAIGVTTIEIVGAHDRKLPTEVWYPVAKGTEGAVTSYVSGVIPSPNGAMRDVAAAAGPFPLVVFSHGNAGVREQSPFLTERLAAWGYVVAAPEHVGNSLPTYDEAQLPAMFIWRTIDVSATIDRMVAPTAADPKWFAGLVDGDHIAVAGHSFGGYTALAIAGAKVVVPAANTPQCEGEDKGTLVCDEIAKLSGPPPWDLSDDRVDLALPMAHAGHAIFDPQSLADLTVPAVLFAAQGDTMTTPTAEAKPTYAALSAPKALILYTGGNHFSFAEMCPLAPFAQGDQKQLIEELCGPGAEPPLAEVHASIAAYTIAAVDLWLKGDETARSAFDVSVERPAWVGMQQEGISPGP